MKPLDPAVFIFTCHHVTFLFRSMTLTARCSLVSSVSLHTDFYLCCWPFLTWFCCISLNKILVIIVCHKYLCLDLCVILVTLFKSDLSINKLRTKVAVSDQTRLLDVVISVLGGRTVSLSLMLWDGHRPPKLRVWLLYTGHHRL